MRVLLVQIASGLIEVSDSFHSNGDEHVFITAQDRGHPSVFGDEHIFVTAQDPMHGNGFASRVFFAPVVPGAHGQRAPQGSLWTSDLGSSLTPNRMAAPQQQRVMRRPDAPFVRSDVFFCVCALGCASVAILTMSGRRASRRDIFAVALGVPFVAPLAAEAETPTFCNSALPALRNNPACTGATKPAAQKPERKPPAAREAPREKADYMRMPDEENRKEGNRSGGSRQVQSARAAERASRQEEQRKADEKRREERKKVDEKREKERKAAANLREEKRKAEQLERSKRRAAAVQSAPSKSSPAKPPPPTNKPKPPPPQKKINKSDKKKDPKAEKRKVAVKGKRKNEARKKKEEGPGLLGFLGLLGVGGLGLLLAEPVNDENGSKAEENGTTETVMDESAAAQVTEGDDADSSAKETKNGLMSRLFSEKKDNSLEEEAE